MNVHQEVLAKKFGDILPAKLALLLFSYLTHCIFDTFCICETKSGHDSFLVELFEQSEEFLSLRLEFFYLIIRYWPLVRRPSSLQPCRLAAHSTHGPRSCS
jgi:hypothetical protein